MRSFTCVSECDPCVCVRVITNMLCAECARQLGAPEPENRVVLNLWLWFVISIMQEVMCNYEHGMFYLILVQEQKPFYKIGLCRATGISNFPLGLAVRITGFHPVGPGSTPGGGSFYFFVHVMYA